MSATRWPRISAPATGPACSCPPGDACAPASSRAKRAVLCGRDWFDAVVRALDADAAVDWHVDEGAWMAAGPGRVELAATRARCSPPSGRRSISSSCCRPPPPRRASTSTPSPAPRRCRGLHHPRHPQDAARSAPGAEIRRARRWRPQPAAGAVARHPDQGKPHRRRRRRGAGAGQRARARCRRRDPDRGRDAGAAARGAGAGASSVLLDNFDLPRMREAVALNAAGRALLEVSGSVRLEQLRAIAATGVHRISIGKPDQGRAGGGLLDACAWHGLSINSGRGRPIDVLPLARTTARPFRCRHRPPPPHPRPSRRTRSPAPGSCVTWTRWRRATSVIDWPPPAAPRQPPGGCTWRWPRCGWAMPRSRCRRWRTRA